MRTAFIDQLIKEARTNDKIFLLVGDLGYNVVEPFAKEFPDRFQNVGIAEQNMAGIAAGLAMTGYNVYIYSIGNFPTLRCIEQIRNDIAYHNANVKVVAVGGGYAYGDLGATHHATEVLGMMRIVPNIVVCSPSDPVETRSLIVLSSTYDGPMYIQLGKSGEKQIHERNINIHLGDVLPFRVNTVKGAVMVTGSIVHQVLASSKYMEQDIYTLPFIKPLNKEHLLSIANQYEDITIVEEHQVSGGVGSAIVEQLNDLYCDGKLEYYPIIHRVGIKDYFQEVSGSQVFLREKANLV